MHDTSPSNELLGLAEDVRIAADDMVGLVDDLVESREIVEKLRRLFKQFDEYCPVEDCGKITAKQSVYDPEHFDPGDGEAPFFSEATLYHIFGKEAARTVLARWHEIGRLLKVYP